MSAVGARTTERTQTSRSLSCVHAIALHLLGGGGVFAGTNTWTKDSAINIIRKITPMETMETASISLATGAARSSHSLATGVAASGTVASGSFLRNGFFQATPPPPRSAMAGAIALLAHHHPVSALK